MSFEILSIGNVAKKIVPDGPLELLQIGQRTRVQGKSGLYVVVGVDAEHHTADLIASAGITPVLKRVPFAQMRPLAVAAIDEAAEGVLPFPT